MTQQSGGGLTHWKKLHNPDYLGAYALNPGQELIVTIKSVGPEQVTGPDGKKDECMVVHFTQQVKPMILNATNAKMISKIHNTPYIEQWVGKSIQIYVDKVKAFGEITEALRIRPIVPQLELPELTASDRRYNEIKTKVQNGTTRDKIELHYKVSDAVWADLQKGGTNA